MSGDWSFEYTSGITGNWPPDANGQPEAPAFLERICGSETEITLTRNMLWAYGVPSVGRYPLDGALGKVILGQSGFGMDIFVPKSMLEDAKNIISTSENDIINEEENQNELP